MLWSQLAHPPACLVLCFLIPLPVSSGEGVGLLFAEAWTLIIHSQMGPHRDRRLRQDPVYSAMGGWS